MARGRLVETAILVVGGVANVAFTLGCLTTAPCGDAHLRAPDDPFLQAHGPNAVPSDTSGATTGATADTGGPLSCADGDPTLLLLGADGDPLPDEVTLAYLKHDPKCMDPDPGVQVLIDGAGLVPGPADVSWTLTVRDEDWPGSEQWTLPCLAAGSGGIGSMFFGLPKKADGTEVTLAVTVVDADGTEVTAKHTFLAHVSED